MRWTRRWFLFVGAYTFGTGAALLLVPDRLPITFEPNEDTWVRILGMLLISISILEVELARSGRPFMLRAGLIHQIAAAAGLAYLAFTRDSGPLRVALAVVVIGL